VINNTSYFSEIFAKFRYVYHYNAVMQEIIINLLTFAGVREQSTFDSVGWEGRVGRPLIQDSLRFIAKADDV